VHDDPAPEHRRHFHQRRVLTIPGAHVRRPGDDGGIALERMADVAQQGAGGDQRIDPRRAPDALRLRYASP
jgi:hypothetical protein